MQQLTPEMQSALEPGLEQGREPEPGLQQAELQQETALAGSGLQHGLWLQNETGLPGSGLQHGPVLQNETG